MRLAESIVQRNVPPLMPQVAAPPPQTLASPKPRSGEGAPPPLRRRKAPEAAPAPWRGRLLNYVLGFVTVILVVDALIGEKGLVDTLRARREHEALAAALAQ